MQRFVTYIYAYENNNKNQNVGFAKVDIRGDYCQVEIHLKRTGYTNVKCPVYLFVRENEVIVGVEIGEIALVNGCGDFVRQLNCNGVGETPYCMKDMKGSLIFLDDTVMFASQWDEKAIYRENFKPYEETKEIPVEQAEDAAEEPEEKSGEQHSEEPAEIRRQADLDGESAEVRKEAAQMEKLQVESVQAQQSGDMWMDLWEKLNGMYGAKNLFENMPEISGIHMELKDLRELPKKYWYLGSNSFLLHGFFNYRHLLLGKVENESGRKWFIGVPGIYQNQEKVLAAVFGFPEFRQEKDTGVKTGQFGYWYRFMDE